MAKAKTSKKKAKTSSLTGDQVVKPLILLEKLEENIAAVRKDFGLLGSSLRIKNKTAQHIQVRVNEDLKEMDLIVDQLKEANLVVAKHSGL